MSIVPEFPVSEIANTFPQMPEEDYDKLVSSIRTDGLLEPIAVWRGEIIDGQHRYRACAGAGVEPRFQFLDDGTDPLMYVISKNDTRRHLDASQRASVYYRLSEWSKAGGVNQHNLEKYDVDLLRNHLLNQQEAARLMKVSDDGATVATSRNLDALPNWLLPG